MKKYFFIVLAVVGLVAGCSERKDPKTLVVVTSGDNPPFEFYKQDQGKRILTGFDIDLAHAIADRLDLTLVIQDIPFNSLISALQSRRADMALAALTQTPERERIIDYSIPYDRAAVSILTLKDVFISDEKELYNKRVGVQLGTSYESHVKDISSTYHITLKSLNLLGELIQELKTKRIDAVITEKSVALAYEAKHPDIHSHPLPMQATLCIGFPKNTPLKNKVNKILEDFTKDGTMTALKDKWFKE